MSYLSEISKLLHYVIYNINKPSRIYDGGILIISIDVDVGSPKLGKINNGLYDRFINDKYSEQELGKIEEKPVVRDGEIVIRTILPLTGTFDHRIVDGAQIGKLARGIKRNFRKPEWLDEVPSAELEKCIFRPAE